MTLSVSDLTKAKERAARVAFKGGYEYERTRNILADPNLDRTDYDFEGDPYQNGRSTFYGLKNLSDGLNYIRCNVKDQDTIPRGLKILNATGHLHTSRAVEKLIGRIIEEYARQGKLAELEKFEQMLGHYMPHQLVFNF